MGYNARDSGHRRVPDPPHSTTGWMRRSPVADPPRGGSRRRAPWRPAETWDEDPTTLSRESRCVRPPCRGHGVLHLAASPSERRGEAADCLAEGSRLLAQRLPARLRDRFASPRGVQPPHERLQSARRLSEVGASPMAIPGTRKLFRLLDVLHHASLQHREQVGAKRRLRDILLDPCPQHDQAARDRWERRRRPASGKRRARRRGRRRGSRWRCWTCRSRRCH